MVRLGILVGHIDKTVQDAHQTVLKLNTVLDDLHGEQKAIHQTIMSANIAAIALDKAAIQEQFYFDHRLPALLDQVSGVLGSTQDAIKAVTTSQDKVTDQTVAVLKTTNDQVAKLGPVLDSAKINLDTLNTTQKDLDALAKNPDIAKSVHNVATGTEALSGAAQDIQHEVHTIVYPKPIVNVVNWGIKIGNLIGTWARERPLMAFITPAQAGGVNVVKFLDLTGFSRRHEHGRVHQSTTATT